MNCKPGDLAVIVRAALKENIGKFVRVIRWAGECTFSQGEHFSSVWIVVCESDMRMNDGALYRAGSEAHCPDSFLRPIRDPGDDATDETLNWLPVPTKETA